MHTHTAAVFNLSSAEPKGSVRTSQGSVSGQLKNRK